MASRGAVEGVSMNLHSTLSCQIAAVLEQLVEHRALFANANLAMLYLRHQHQVLNLKLGVCFSLSSKHTFSTTS